MAKPKKKRQTSTMGGQLDRQASHSVPKKTKVQDRAHNPIMGEIEITKPEED